MVFEAVVVELLNKFLRQYVENLDTSQLKIGIWGGDVVLNDLKIKTTLFDDFDLPIRVKWGKLGKFAMNIPWKNLYSAQVSVTLENLLVIIIPNSEFKYDPVKEEKWEIEKKQAKLKAIDEARKRELDPESAKQTDSFVEKLLTQIIKNIQVTISNIHIRYEDKTTIPNSPISIGLTLSNLSAQTTATDPSGYFTKMLKENENFICKIVKLEGLAIYWNTNSELYSNLLDKELARILINTIPKPGIKTNNMYVFGPLTSAAFLRLNPKPEMDGTNFKIPKIFVQILLKEIGLAVTHNQFCDCMDVLEDSHRLQAANKYKKYRPVGIPVTGHIKEWWQFAYKCVTEEIIRRKLGWNWENIKTHRNLCRRYAELYKLKLTSRKLTAEQTEELAALEKKLNVLNLILIREQAHMEIEREVIVKRSENKSTSWFSGWFSSRSDSVESSNGGDELVKKIENAMTPQEKEKLYKAIGYEESAPPTKYPPTFVQFQFWFHLEEIKMTVYDDSISHPVPIMTMSVKDVRTEFEQRTSMNAYKLVAIIGNFRVIGKADKHGKYPELVTSHCKKSESLVEVLYATKPLDSSCDQQIHVNARPLKIVYHARTINLVRETFTIKTKEMEKIVAATSASLPTFQKITAFGLQYAIEKRVVLEVKVNVMSSHLIIPYEGEYHQDKDMLVIMLGKLTIETEKNEKEVSVKKLYLEGTTDEEIFSTVVSASYTNFKISLTGVQILFQLSGEDWVAASKVKGPSPMRFLESTNLELIIKKSLVRDDARIPKIIIQGTLPNLTLNLSEKRFVGVVALACSIPTRSENAPPVPKGPPSSWSIQTLGVNLESKLAHIQKDLSMVRPIVEFTQGIDLIGHFEITEFIVIISKSKEKEKHGEDEKFMKLKVTLMEVEITSKTFETLYLLKVGGINFNHYHLNSVVPVLSSRGIAKKHYLVTVEYVNLDTKIPDFFSARQGVVNRLTLTTSALNVLINKEALLAQIKFARHIQSRMDKVKEEMKVDRQADAGKLKDEDAETIGKEEKKVITKGKRFRKKSRQEVIDMLLVVVLEDINVIVDYKENQLCEFSLKGTKVNISSRKSSVVVDFTLKEIFLLDLSPLTLYPKIVASLEDQTVSSRVTMYNKEYFGDESTVDTTIDAQVSLIQLTFVNIFFARAFKFLSAFQSQIESIKEGASVAAQRAKENLITAYQNQAQVCLNIEVTAPILIVPKLSTSFETIILDMGVFTLKNTIHELDIVPAEVNEGRRPLIDTMKLHLEQVKIGRCYLKNADSCTNNMEKTFVVPVTLEITVKRNLSVGWFRVIPDLEVYARLGAIHVQLSHEDICIIVGIMRGNVNEGVKPMSPKAAARMRAHRKALKEKAAKSAHAGSTHESVKEKSENEEMSNYTMVKFTFDLDQIRFDATAEKESENEEPEGLARFILQTLSLKGRMFSDGSIQTCIMLISCLIDDMRPGKSGRLTRLMERSADVYSNSDQNDTVNSMIQIRFNKRDMETFVDVKVYKFTLILSMDFLQKLGEFFSHDEPSPSTRVDYVGKIPLKGEENDENNPTSTFTIRLEKPDIIIVENMDSIDTDALIFNVEMVMKHRVIGSRQVISATLADIELYSCCFNPAKRPHTLSQVIKPFTISVAGSTPEHRGLHLDICFTEIAITINPVTIDLLAKCYEALFKDPLADQQTSTEMDLSNLFDAKPFQEDDFWFLKPDEGLDVLSQSSVLSVEKEIKITDEICLLAIPSIVLTIEGRSHKRALPLILVEMGFQMQCYNWRHKFSMNSSLTVQLQYYNKTLTAWEPLVEPVEVNPEKEESHSYAPWELTCTLVLDEEGEIEDITPPKIQMTVGCSDMLQITLTKTCLDVLQVASETYSSAVKKRLGKVLPEMPPFIVINKTGIVAELLLVESQLQVCKSLKEAYEILKLDPNSEVELQIASDEDSTTAHRLHKSLSKLDSKLFFKFPLCSKQVYQLPLGMSSKRYYPFPLGDFNKVETWGLVSEVSVEEITTKVILRSILRIQNDFNDPIHIHALLENETEAEFIGTVEGKSSFPLPFHAIYRSTKLLFFSVSGYRLSSQPFLWEDIKNEIGFSVLLQCDSITPETNDPFFIQAVGETEHIYYSNTRRKTMSSMCYIIYLQPTVKIFNSLPVPLDICCQGVGREKVLLPGNTIEITSAEPGYSTITLRISNYLEKEWSCKENIQEYPPEYFVWEFLSFTGLAPEVLNVGVRVTFKKSTAVYAIYCPYFMVNKTEYLLAYKFEGNSPIFYHPGDYNQPIMFSPPAKKFFSKKLACLQVEHSSWSDRFPVDVAGSGGLVECENASKNMIYTISVTINLTQNSLTKIVTFTPYYIFVNSTNYDLQCVEWNLQDNYWIDIPKGSCTPFWPASQSRERIIQVRPKGVTETSPPFSFTSTDNILLRLKHKIGAIFADIQVTNSGTFIMFQNYEKGQAPVLLINHSQKAINILEKETKFTVNLQPMQQMLHAWVVPTKDRKLIVKNPKHMKDILIVDQDSDGTVFLPQGEAIRYVSFLDGTQRTLLFTEEESLCKSISNMKTVSSSGIEIIFKIQGIGVSVVNDLTRNEILYLSLISSNITWEAKKSGKTKFVKLKDDKLNRLEAAYQKYLDDCETQPDVNPIIPLSDKMVVNLEKMEIILPHHKQLRRVFEPGVWAAYRYLEGQAMFHLKVNRIQIDNQLLDCVFPIVLTPVPPPKTVVAELRGPRPFFELSILKLTGDQTGVTQYKYFKILVQEFHVKFDIGFLQNMYEFMTKAEATDEEEKEKFRKELELTGRPLMMYVEVGSSTGRKHFFELLHFSPLKIHFSFSLAGNFDSSSLPPALTVIMQSVGVTLTDVHDVIFRLSYFERKSLFLTKSQLVTEAMTHYYGQTIRQAYVLLLGLDVIGNPFGLIVGIGEGVEAFFYEPFQGIVQGPSDFAEGVAIGCKRFFKGTVGSTAGTLEKLTGTLGKGLAVLSLDKEYQMQRLENTQREETIQASMVRGGRGLFMGVFDGVTGIVRKPIEGAKEEGVGGFFKGMGKGMMGLVTRPVSGVVDFASTSLNAVKRATVGVYGNKRVRPPRFFRDEFLVRPYHFYDAKGNLIFHSLCKRKYCATDRYEYHFEMRDKEYVILTNKRVILAEYNETFNSWQEHMAITWSSMPESPRCHTKGIALTLRFRFRKKTQIGGKPEVKILLIEDVAVKDRILKKMVELYNIEQEQCELS